MNDCILMTYCAYDKTSIKEAIKNKSNCGEDYLTLLIETKHGSFHTVTATYFNDDGDELYMLDHPSFNMSLDDVVKFAVLKVL